MEILLRGACTVCLRWQLQWHEPFSAEHEQKEERKRNKRKIFPEWNCLPQTVVSSSRSRSQPTDRISSFVFAIQRHCVQMMMMRIWTIKRVRTIYFIRQRKLRCRVIFVHAEIIQMVEYAIMELKLSKRPSNRYILLGQRVENFICVRLHTWAHTARNSWAHGVVTSLISCHRWKWNFFGIFSTFGMDA